MTKDKLLFTPGPLTTSATVKEAMLHDAGSRDRAFIETVREIRHCWRLAEWHRRRAKANTSVS